MYLKILKKEKNGKPHILISYKMKNLFIDFFK